MSLFFNDTATTEIYTYLHTLSLHDALPICKQSARRRLPTGRRAARPPPSPPRSSADAARRTPPLPIPPDRSEEHTSELQSLMRISYAVFCLKKKKKKHIIKHTKLYINM